MLTELERIAWAAGVFEGEGSAILGRSGDGGVYRRLQITNTEPDVVDRAQHALRVGTIQVGRRQEAHHKPELFWTIDRWTDLERLANLFYPFLGSRRRAAVDAIFDRPAKRALISGRFVRMTMVHDPRANLRNPTDVEWWAWAAGLFEGEGSAICRPMSRSRSTQLQRRLQLPLADRDVLERFASVVGAGKIRRLKDRGLTRKGNRRKPMYIWTCSRWPDVERVCARFLPFMGCRRTAQVTFLLAHPAGPIGRRPPTECKRGHPLAGPCGDVYVYGRERQCRRCKAMAYEALKAGVQAARRRAKLRCIRGHPLEGPGADVYVWRGMRQCRPCARASRQDRRVRGTIRPRRPRAAT